MQDGLGAQAETVRCTLVVIHAGSKHTTGQTVIRGREG